MASQDSKSATYPTKSFVVLEEYLGRNNGQTNLFKKGETVVGYFVPPPPNARVLPLVNSNGYLIPASILREVPAIQVPKEKDALKQTKVIVRNNSFKKGAILGLALGAGYGYFNNKSVIYSSFIGMLAGGALSYMLWGKKNDSDTSSTIKTRKVTLK